MAKVSFKRVESINDLNSIDIEDGNFIITGDSNAFIDYGSKRIPIGGTPDNQMDDSSNNSVQNKIIKKYIDDKTLTNSKDIEKLKENNIYSTEEKVIGKWIDGKIIYKRTFNLGVLDNIGKEKLYTFDGNYHDIIKKESTISRTEFGQTPLPVLDFVSNVYLSDHVETNRDTKKLQIHLRRNNEEFYIGWTYILTVYYTKTTDEVSE